MSGSRFLAGFGGWLASMLLAAGAELTTVAYVVDRTGFEELGSEWQWRGGGHQDPFAEDAPEKFVEPVRLEKKPNGSRFFANGDRMWLLTGTLRQQKILETERSWAVWNEDRNRLVVHGTPQEHGFVAILWEDLHSVSLVETSVELVKVGCREVAGVDWTEEEVRKRGGQVLHVIATTTRPGQKASAVIATEAGEVRLEVEPHTDSTGMAVDLRLNYEAAVRHADGVRKLTVNTGMALFGGHRVYVEVGGEDGAEETYLLGVESFTKGLDGTPRWRWREFEDESIQEKPPERFKEHHEQLVLADGMVLMRVSELPGFLECVSDRHDDIDPFAAFDPFAADAGGAVRVRELAKELGVPVAKSLVGVPGCLMTDLVFDMTGYMKERGVVAPEGGWIYYNNTRSVLIAKLDREGTELLEILTEALDDRSTKMIRGTASLIEWEGALEPGEIPAGARRLARAGEVARPGQKVTVWHCGSEEALKRGVRLELEQTIGANNRILDVWIDLEVAGERPVRLATGLTLVDGEPVVVPLGEVDGKQLGVVVECWIIDGTGAGVER